MKNNIGIIILLFCFGLNGQNKIMEYPTEPNGEKSYTYNYFKKILIDLSVDSLEISKNEFHFRFITPRHILEIWKTKDLKPKGKIISFVEKQPDSMNLEYHNNEIKKKYYKLESNLKQKRTIHIYKKLTELQLDKIPSSTMPIGESKKNLILLEFSNKTDYKFKEFWVSNEKTKQNEFDKKIIGFDKLMTSTMNYEQLYNDLVDSLPNGCFNMANGFVKCIK
ncbi:hypothetical protein ACFQ1R_13020 [Mariniflexile jejuense]|uniref:GLPGLI family protein n=1 Tax=Mariniflexile jejuense TaxID=1173582 RepID=A0ABW3JND4_9FLAO